MKLIDEFKAFALRGSVIDLAVGVVIGAAFGKVVSSLVADIIMPPLGWLIGGVDFTSLAITLPETVLSHEPVSIKYGNFIQTIFDFMIIALAVFFAVKAMIRLHVKEEKKAAPAPDPQPSKEELLLTEIRDLLKENRN